VSLPLFLFEESGAPFWARNLHLSERVLRCGALFAPRRIPAGESRLRNPRLFEQDVDENQPFGSTSRFPLLFFYLSFALLCVLSCLFFTSGRDRTKPIPKRELTTPNHTQQLLEQSLNFQPGRGGADRGGAGAGRGLGGGLAGLDDDGALHPHHGGGGGGGGSRSLGGRRVAPGPLHPGGGEPHRVDGQAPHHLGCVDTGLGCRGVTGRVSGCVLCVLPLRYSTSPTS